MKVQTMSFSNYILYSSKIFKFSWNIQRKIKMNIQMLKQKQPPPLDFQIYFKTHKTSAKTYKTREKNDSSIFDNSRLHFWSIWVSIFFDILYFDDRFIYVNTIWTPLMVQQHTMIFFFFFSTAAPFIKISSEMGLLW